ncbi:MAG: hypothetical protein JOS17DRAFT_788992 [Linnemannia elongata]|nr:MAG: hypothetical protein JOS17DRAFT_788992 [Linnemannia elongata]
MTATIKILSIIAAVLALVAIATVQAAPVEFGDGGGTLVTVIGVNYIGKDLVPGEPSSAYTVTV